MSIQKLQIRFTVLSKTLLSIIFGMLLCASYSIAGDFQISNLGQKPVNPVDPSTQSIAYTFTINNVSTGYRVPYIRVRLDGVENSAQNPSFSIDNTECENSSLIPGAFVCDLSLRGLSAGARKSVALRLNKVPKEIGTHRIQVGIDCRIPSRATVEREWETCGNAGGTGSDLGNFSTEIAGSVLQFSKPTWRVTEGNTSVQVIVNRSGSSAGSVSVDYLSVNGTAVRVDDYTAVDNTLVWDDGDTTSKTISVSITDDSIVESLEKFQLVLSNVKGDAQLGSLTTAEISITDDDTPLVSITRISHGAESGASKATFRFTVADDPSRQDELEIRFAVTGSATLGGDYSAPGTVQVGNNLYLIIPAGVSSADLTLSVVDDSIYEVTEDVTFSLLTIENFYRIGNPSAATLNITDNDTLVVSLIASDNVATEDGTDLGEFYLSLNRPAGANGLAVNVSRGGTARQAVVGLNGWIGDYYPFVDTDVVFFQPGEIDAFLDVQGNEDFIVEENETIVLGLAPGTGYTIDTSNAIDTIELLDNDLHTVVVTADTVSVTEDSGSVVSFTFTLAQAATGNGLRIYFDLPGSATIGEDYSTPDSQNSVLIPAGARTETKNFTVINDDIVEPLETIIVDILSDSTYNIGNSYSAQTDITDTDLPVIRLSSGGNAFEPATDGHFIFSVENDPDRLFDVIVDFDIAGTATSGVDYTSLDSPLTIPAGYLSVSLDLLPLDDSIVEPAETVRLSPISSTDYDIDTPSFSIFIIDNDKPRITISATDSQAAERNQDPGEYTIDVVDDPDRLNAITVQLVSSGSATSGVDYEALPSAITIPANISSVRQSLLPFDDNVVEFDETVVVDIIPDPSYVVNGSSQATVNIINRDLPVASLQASLQPANEQGLTNSYFDINLSYPAPVGGVVVNYSVGGNAIEGMDYQVLSGAATIPESQRSVRVDIIPIQDTEMENAESVTVSLQPGVAYQRGKVFSDSVSIEDDDLPIVEIIASDASAAEKNQDPGQYRFTISNDPNLLHTAFNLQLQVSGSATPDVDYIALANNFTFPVNSSSANLNLLPYDDDENESDESVVVAILPDPSYTVGNSGSSQVTIVNRDLPRVSVVSTISPISESGTANGEFSINLNEAAGPGGLTINYSIGGSANEVEDYNTIARSVTVSESALSARVSIIPVNNNEVEADENVRLTLLEGNGYELSSTIIADVNIQDDDIPLVSVISTDANAAERNQDPGEFTFSISNDPQRLNSVTIAYQLSGSATFSVDYTAASTVTIPAGANSTLLPIYPIDDNQGAEADETVVVTLAPNAGIHDVEAPDSATVVIANRVLPNASISANVVTAEEATVSNGQFTVSLDDVAPLGGLTVNYTVTGTAGASDYVALSGNLFFPAGSQNEVINVTPLQDDLVEQDESVVVTLQSGSAYNLTPAITDTVNIVDNDLPIVVINASDPNASEVNLDSGAYTFSVINDPQGLSPGITVNFSVTGTGFSGDDYQPLPSQITLASGQGSRALPLIPINNSDNETDSVIISLGAGSGYEVGNPNTATVSIVDAGPPVVNLFLTSSPASEQGGVRGEFLVALEDSVASQAGLTVYYAISGSAIAGLDYQTLSGNVTIPYQSSTASIDVFPIDDDLVEQVENVQLTISSHANYTLGGTSNQSLDIIDNDLPNVSVVANDATATEKNNEPGQFTFSINNDDLRQNNVLVNYAVNGTASSGVDYQTLGSVAINAGSNSASLDVNPIDDNDGTETNETVTVSVLNSVNVHGVAAPDSATVTITNRTLPVANINATTSIANEATQSSGRFAVSLNDVAPAGGLTVNYVVSASSTASPSDYQALTGNLFFAANSQTGVIDITPLQDDLVEPDETVIVTLSAGIGYTLSTSISDTVTIQDNDKPRVTVTAIDPNAAEEGLDPGLYEFRIDNDALRRNAITVTFATSGTATAGDDYISLPSSVTISAQTNSVTLPLTPLTDIVPDAGEQVIVSLLGGSSYEIGNPDIATVSIADAGLPSASISATTPVPANEGAGNGEFTVSLSNTTGDNGLLIQYAVSGTADNGADYVTLTGEATIPAQSNSVVIPVTLINDDLVEATETLTLTLLTTANYRVGADAEAAMNLTDNDLPNVSVVANDATATEKNTEPGQFTFNINNDDLRQNNVLVNYAVNGTASSGVDYQTLGSATITAGSNSASLDVNPLDDNDGAETNETVTVSVLNSVNVHGVAAPDSATVTITNRTLPVASINATINTANEATQSSGRFTVNLDDVAPAGGLTVNYVASASSTASPSDYQALTGNLFFAANSQTGIIDITPLQDDLVEPNETVIVTLSAGIGYTLSTSISDTVTIQDNDKPRVTVTAIDPNAAEEGLDPGLYEFRIDNDALRRNAITVTFATSGTATAGDDYISLPSSVTISAQTNSVTLPLTPLTDIVPDAGEQVIVSLLGGSSYEIGNPDIATVSIADAGLPSASISATTPVPANEGAGNGEFTVSLSNTTGDNGLLIQYAVSGTADNGADYVTLTGEATIPAQSNSVVIPVTLINDDLVEATETLTLTLLTTANYRVGADAEAAMNLTDNDLPNVSVVANDATATEKNTEPGQFTFNINNDDLRQNNVLVNYAVNGTASSGVDYQTLGSVAINAGSNSASLDVNPLDDNDGAETNETVTVTVLNSVNVHGVAAPDSATVTITNRTLPVASINATTSIANEATQSSGRFTVSLNDVAPAGGLTVNYVASASSTASASDYQALTGNLFFAANSQTGIIDITPLQDDLVEPDETVIVTLSTGTGYTLSTSISDTVTIQDDDKPRVTVTAIDPNAAEEGLDPGLWEFRIDNDEMRDRDVTVNFQVNGTATPDEDFDTLPTSVTISANSLSTTLDLTPLADLVADSIETVILSLESDVAYEIGSPNVATVNIADAGLPSVSVSLSQQQLDEDGPDAGEFSVTLNTNADANGLAIQYVLSGTAENGVDYEQLNGEAFIPANSNQVAIPVTAIDDNLVENAESVVITLQTTSDYSVSANDSAELFIEDNDKPLVQLNVSDPNGSEQDQNRVVYTFSITNDPLRSNDVTVNFSKSGTATEVADYVSFDNVIVIPANQTEVELPVVPILDSEIEERESIILTLATGSGYEIGINNTATAFIDDKGLPEVNVSVEQQQSFENASKVGRLQFSLSEPAGPNGLTVEFDYTGSAEIEKDFELARSVVIPANSQNVLLDVPVYDDALVESLETIQFSIQSAGGYVVGSNNTAEIQIIDNDQPNVQVRVVDAVASEEGNDSAEVVFNIDNDAQRSQVITVLYALTGDASNGNDYKELSGSIEIPAGEVEAALSIEAISDSEIENIESLIIDLSANSSYVIGSDKQATVTISDTVLPIVKLAVSQAEANEEELVPAKIKFSLNQVNSKFDLTIKYKIETDSTAVADEDYEALSGEAVITNGEQFIEIEIVPLQDQLIEGNESVIISLLEDPAYVIDSEENTNEINILDNDFYVPPVVSIHANDEEANEQGEESAEFTITLDKPAGADGLIIQYEVSGTATELSNESSEENPGDYQSIERSIVFEAGQSELKIAIIPIDDGLIEEEETVNIKLLTSDLYTLTETPSAEIRIVDNDVRRSKATAISIASEDEDKVKSIGLDDDVSVDILVLDENNQPLRGVPVVWSISSSQKDEVVEFVSTELVTNEEGRAIALFHTASDPRVYTVDVNADLENQDGTMLSVKKRILYSSAIDAREKAATIQLNPVAPDEIKLQGLDKDVEVEIDVLDENSQPLSDVAVSWALTSNIEDEQVTIVSEENITDSNGRVGIVFHTAPRARRYRLDVTVGDNTLSLYVNSGITVLAKPDTPEAAVAIALDSLCVDLEAGTALSDRCDEIAQAAVDGNDPAVLNALKAMAPEEVAAQMDMGSTITMAQLNNIGQRLSALRRGAKGISVSGLSLTLRGQTVSGQLLNYLAFDDLNGFSASDESGGLLNNKLSFFASGHINTGERDATGLENGFKFDSKGLTFGADYRATSKLVYGMALGYSNTDLNLSGDGSGLDANGTSLSAYSLFFSSPKSYVTGVVNLGMNSIDMSREINFGIGSATPVVARGKTQNKNISFSIGGGYELLQTETGFNAEINGRADYLRANINAYQESGASEFNLNINSQSVNSLLFNLGGKVSYSISTRWAVILPYAGVSFEHSEESNHDISGYFLADPNKSVITFNTDKPDQNYFRLNTGFTAVLPKGFSVYAQYDTVMAKDLYKENNYSFGGRYEKQF